MTDSEQYVVATDVSTVSLTDLRSEDADLAAAIAKGFGNGPDCLGIIIVKDLDEKFSRLRSRLLRLASVFADLPEDAKAAVTHTDSSYLFGWSHGKELMDGKPDFAKGSYYNNPVIDDPADPDFAKNFPAYGFPNVWPKELPELKEAFLELGRYVTDVGILLAGHCDRYVSSAFPDLPQNLLKGPIRDSKIHKARLLHYFPMSEEELKSTEGKLGSWCGIHIDHSMLTGLTSAMFIDAKDPSYSELNITNTEVAEALKVAGLYIRSRSSQLVKVLIPKNCLAFQIGEASQVASRGLLVATPHLVRGGAAANIARNTFAVFLQPNVDHKLTPEKTFDDLTAEVMKRHY
ncbi:hypothetical protein DFJ73DRAFT_836010 [Zopfochytrium polystomum]|nr:hypothetical protein DFJ73DRAFT_836010 [Zopfochytrium polystomum]